MRIALLTLEALAAAAPVRRFVAEQPERVALVALSDPFRRQRGGVLGQARYLLGRSGTRFLPYLAINFVLPRLVGLVPLRRQRAEATRLAVLCARLGIPVAANADMNSEGFRERLKTSGAEVLVTFHCDQILAAETIAAVPRGGINVHAGLLPDQRGPVPTLHALLEPSPRFGVTLHRLVPRMTPARSWRSSGSICRPPLRRWERRWPCTRRRCRCCATCSTAWRRTRSRNAVSPRQRIAASPHARRCAGWHTPGGAQRVGRTWSGRCRHRRDGASVVGRSVG